MAGVFKTVTFMVLVFSVVVLAEDYDVGGDSEWARPADPEVYKTWAAGKTFRVGDELEFEFAAGRHDVAVVTKQAFEDCVKEKPIALFTNPPVKIPLNTTGPHYFICTIGDHCRFGQKLTINVVGAGAAATPGAGGGASPGAGGATPTTPAGSTTTPPGNAASSLGGATSLVAIVSAFVALF